METPKSINFRLPVRRMWMVPSQSNTDNIDYEDRVHDLAMLVFDSGTGEKVAEYYESGIAMCRAAIRLL